MSYTAEKWARQQKTGNARAKAVLLELANCFNSETGKCCPSLDHLCEVTELDRHTVINAIRYLVENHFVEKIAIKTTKGRGVQYNLLGFMDSAEIHTMDSVETNTMGSVETNTIPEGHSVKTRTMGSVEIHTTGSVGFHTRTSNIKVNRTSNKEKENIKEKESEFFSLTPDEEKPRRITKASLTKPSDASDKVFSDWVDFKRKVSKTISQYMINAITREAKKAGISTEQAMIWQMESGYQGFKADWYLKDQSQRTQTAQAQKKPEPKKELSPDDFTDKQISFFAYKLSRYQPFGSKYGQGCDSYDTFATKIEGWLRHPRNFLECLPYLKELHLVN